MLAAGLGAALVFGGAAAAPRAAGQSEPGGASSVTGQPDPVHQEAARTAHLTLAAEDRLYLVLDADTRALTLYHGGAALRTWTAGEMTVGARRLPLGRGAALEDWRAPRTWTGGEPAPRPRMERRVIHSATATPPDPSGAVDWIPPTPEEAVPAPARFVLRFPDGLGLEVVAADAPGSGFVARLGDVARRAWSAVRPWSWDRYRVRLVLPATEAGALYRGLPPDATLLTLLPR